MSALIPNHDHCAICGRAIPYAEPKERTAETRTCGKEHAAEYQAVQKKRRRSVTLMYVLMGVAALVLVLSAMGAFPK